MNERLIHDCALMMAAHYVEMVGNLLREEERITAREEFYHVCKAGIECFEIQKARLLQRLNPTNN